MLSGCTPHSTTQSAVGNNINLIVKNGEIPTALSRDTEKANQRVNEKSLAELRTNQEIASLAGQIGSNIVGDVGKMLNLEDGSAAKVALHGVVGYLSAQMSGGNVAAGATSAMSAEYLNTQVANYLLEQQAQGKLSEEERHLIQQATATSIGGLVGAAVGGKNAVGQEALTALNAEKYNRQLHPDEMKWIKANAKRFAQENGTSVEEAEKRLAQQAAKDNDILWFLKSAFTTDEAAKAFLAAQSKNTFIDDDGKKQHYFVSKGNDFWTPRKYAKEAYNYDASTGGNFFKQNLHTKNTIEEGAAEKASIVANYVKDNPKEVVIMAGNAVKEGITECFQDTLKCGGDVVSNAVSTVETLGSSAVEMGKNLFLIDKKELDAIYGEDTEVAMTIAASSQFIGSVNIMKDIVGAGEIVKKLGTVKTADVNSNKINVDDKSTIVCGTACFVAGTLINTANGLKPIEQINVDDLVWSRAEFGDTYALQPVIARKATENQEIFEVIVENQQGKREIYKTTSEHPFYVAGIGWLKASLLTEGMRLLDQLGNPTINVISQRGLDYADTVYNFEVANFRTYHIGELGVWVHNANCCDFANKKYGDVEAKFKERGWVDPTGKVMYVDPFDGKFKPFPDGSKPSVDHIFPQSEFSKQIEGFNKLSKELQQEIIHSADNLQPLPKNLNSSKGSKIETGTAGWEKYMKEGKNISPEYREYLRIEQNRILMLKTEEVKKHLKKKED